MVNSAIKSNAFVSYKESCFYKMTNLDRRKVRYFCLRHEISHENVLYKAFTRNIPRIVTDHVKFYPKCFSFGSLL